MEKNSLSCNGSLDKLVVTDDFKEKIKDDNFSFSLWGKQHCSIIDEKGKYHFFDPEQISISKRKPDMPLRKYMEKSEVWCVYDKITMRNTEFSASDGHKWTRFDVEMVGSFTCRTPKEEEFEIKSVFINAEHDNYERES